MGFKLLLFVQCTIQHEYKHRKCDMITHAHGIVSYIIYVSVAGMFQRRGKVNR